MDKVRVIEAKVKVAVYLDIDCVYLCLYFATTDSSLFYSSRKE